MSDTATHSSATTTTAAGLAGGAERQHSVGELLLKVAKRALAPLASLKLTVTLFALSIFLVFAGTLAQVDQGIWHVMDQYFRTGLAWIELDIFFPGKTAQKIGLDRAIPYPGGWLLGGLLLVNLIAAHAVRFRINERGRKLMIGVLAFLFGAVVFALGMAIWERLPRRLEMEWLGAVGTVRGLVLICGLLTLGLIYWFTAEAHRAATQQAKEPTEQSLGDWVRARPAAVGLIALTAGLTVLLMAASLTPVMDSLAWRSTLPSTLGSLLVIAGLTVLFKKRSGIVLTHAGLIVLLLSEAVTGLYAQEGNMTIEEGQTASYVQDIRKAELAVIDRSGEEENEVVAVPESMLDPEPNAWQKLAGGFGLWSPPSPVRISHEHLPFDVEVNRYMRNSGLVRASAAPESIRQYAFPVEVRRGTTQMVPKEKPEVSGTAQEQQADTDAAIVTFKKKKSDEVIAKHLVSVWHDQLDHPLKVEAGGKTYDVYLRFQRRYKPYKIHLIEFKHDKYVGTDTPKNFESVARLIDEDNNVNRKVNIYMNHPLRYAGDTLYQSSFLQDQRNPGGDAFGTVLQVVNNPGRLVPYVACGLVAGGLLVHFGMSLVGFVRKRVLK